MLPEPFRKPDIAACMKLVGTLENVNPDAWAKTYEYYGITADEVRAAQTAELERRLREPVEAEGD